MLSDRKVLEVLEKYRISTNDPDLQVALSVVLDWRGSAAYYESEARNLRIETQRLRDKIDQLTAQLEAAHKCLCGGCAHLEG